MNGDSLESAVPTPQIPRVKDPILEGTEDIPHRGERQTPPMTSLPLWPTPRALGQAPPFLVTLSCCQLLVSKGTIPPLSSPSLTLHNY